MSVPKSKRSKSSVEFERVYFNVADDADNLIEHGFYVSHETLQNNAMFIENRSRALSQLTDDLLYNIKIANSIYPTCERELDERRIHIGKAIGVCYAILTQYTRIMGHLKIRDDKYVDHIEHIIKMINSLKAWRKSDNRFKKKV